MNQDALQSICTGPWLTKMPYVGMLHEPVAVDFSQHCYTTKSFQPGTRPRGRGHVLGLTILDIYIYTLIYTIRPHYMFLNGIPLYDPMLD